MVVADGFCDLHWRRMRRSGTTEARRLPTTEERFWSYVTKGGPDECWPWARPAWTSGYGGLRVNGIKVAAHRLSYELLVGPIPEGLVIDHLCRVRICVNPRHLEPVTFRENILRGAGTGAHHARKTHCLRGHPFEPPNGYTNSMGYRGCHACDRIRYAARRERGRLRVQESQ